MARQLRPYFGAALLALAVAAAGCGGADDSAGTAAPTTAAPVVTTTALPPTTVAFTSTTTQATTTTSDVHPAWDVGWAALWPPDGATAYYRVTLWGGGSIDLPARIDYGIDWQGGTWDRITMGDIASGEWGLALYFARPEPWVLHIWGLETTMPGGQGSLLEHAEEVGVLDLRGLPETMARIDAGVLIHDAGGDAPDPMSGTYALSVVGVEIIEVAAGTLEDALHLQLNLGGDFFGAAGPDEFTEVSDIWIQPGQLIVMWGRPAPAFESFELLTPWE